MQRRVTISSEHISKHTNKTQGKVARAKEDKSKRGSRRGRAATRALSPAAARAAQTGRTAAAGRPVIKDETKRQDIIEKVRKEQPSGRLWEMQMTIERATHQTSKTVKQK
jgi:hypothetical protein